MQSFQKYTSLFSEEWKEKYHAILAEEHLENLQKNIQKFKNQVLDWDQPYFNE